MIELCSVKNAALISGNHVLNVDKRVLTPVHLKHFECLLNQIAQVLRLPLTVVDLVAEIVIANLEQIQDGEDLAVVRHERLAYGVGTGD